MIFKKILSFVLFFICMVFNTIAVGKSDSFYYQNSVFREGIKSVQLYRDGFENSNPQYTLGTDATLVFKFDDLSEEAKNYTYTIIHCDADWNESYMQQSEYLTDLFDLPINDYALSTNTTVKFVNYQIRIPNEDCTPKLSGNYALLVFENNDRNDLVLIQRFFVVEPLVRIDAIVKKATFDPFNGANQEVDFKIFHEKLRLMNPREDIKVVLMQNRRWDNAIRNLKPSDIKENLLIYDYSKENVFPGGNEFRFFDIRTSRHNGENVNTIEFSRPYFHATLTPDAVRSNKTYEPYQEMNGNFKIESQDRVSDYDTECDYEFVHFFLPMQSQLLGGSVNVFGALTGWNANQSNEMKWNFEHGGYELTLLLKQGYYNYQYVYVAKGSKKADAENIEGSFFITENEYQIYAYYRDQGSRYDRLVGFTTVNSLVK